MPEKFTPCPQAPGERPVASLPAGDGEDVLSEKEENLPPQGQ